ncbi:MAG: hypothetical protein ACYC8T_00085 [Myxococcaceae bacterium]
MLSAAPAAVVCAHCGIRTVAGADPRCPGCGAALRLLEPFAVQCGWCDAENRRDQVDRCLRCGGPLPALPGGHPGPRPPQMPRGLPAGYRGRILYWKNVPVLIGMMFSLVFCWTVIFPIIGIPLWVTGYRNAKRKLMALVFGAPTPGKVTRVEVDMSQHINRRHPWLIHYEFQTGAGVRQGRCEAWDPSNAKRSPGDVLWVVYVQGHSGENAIWPPIR